MRLGCVSNWHCALVLRSSARSGRYSRSFVESLKQTKGVAARSLSHAQTRDFEYLRGVPGADDWEPALTDLLVLLPWTYAGTIVIDGYWVPYYKRLLGLL